MNYPEKEELIERYRHYTDPELLQILKRRNDYQPSAIEAAQQVATERGLAIEPPAGQTSVSGSRIFPMPSSASGRMKLAQSLQRMLYFVAVVPFVAGVLNLAEGANAVAAAYLGATVGWLLASLFAFRRRDSRIALAFFPIMLALAIVRFANGGLPASVSVNDVVVAGLAVLAVVYAVCFYRAVLKSEC